ncbi:hypothetical protein BD410DRAFT_896267 [Rickenella mellea]|uniref:Uncharacterized protein n=1 Tax=Rickenella mellea TaxID=50990 RepID=A0A4Y7QDU5_9AGAM|nr:hypothetical protein BD410DRAFT_896267 [Rickenella mellea]
MSEFWHSGGRSNKDPSRKKVALRLDSAPLQFALENEPNFTAGQLECQHELPSSPSQMVGGFEQHSLLTRGFANLDSLASDSPTSQSFDSPFTDTNSLPPYCPSCACLANPSSRASLEFLANQIQRTLDRLQKLPEHARDSQCPIYQIIELNSILCDALQSARFDGHSNFSASHYCSLIAPHAPEEEQLWGSSHSKDGSSP